jgi:hypothetical protein
MENRESLEQSHHAYKKQIEDELDGLKTKAQSVGKKALIVGGSVLVVYTLVALFTSKPQKKKELKSFDQEVIRGDKSDLKPIEVKRTKVESAPSFLTGVVKEQVLAFALGLAAKKLEEFLQDIDKNNQKSDS